MSEAEFSPQTIRRNQMLLGGGILSVVLLLAYFWVDSDNKSVEAPPPPQPKTVNINAPGALVDDKDAWRGQADKELNEMTKRLSAMELRLQQKVTAESTPPGDPGQLTAIPDDLKKIPTREPALADVDDYNKAETRRRAELEQQNRKRGTWPPQPPPPTPPSSRAATPVAPPPGRPGEDVSVASAPVPAVEKPRGIKTEEIKDVAGTTPPAGGKTDGAAPATSAARIHVGNYIPTGSFVKVAVLMGIDAPTGGQAQTNALPVLLHVTDLASLPNRFRHDIKDCVITAFGTGDVSSHRVMVRTETLACVRTDGTVIETALKGHVAGEDGKYGFRGRLVEKQGQVMANAALAALASGIGTAFQQSTVTQSVSPLGAMNSVSPEKSIQSGVSSGVGNAMNMIARHWLSVAEKIFPVLEVDAGRVGEVVIAKGVSLPDSVGGADASDFPELERRNKRMNRYEEI